MPSLRSPADLLDSLAVLESSRSNLVEAAYDFHGNAQWESLLSTASELISVEAEMRSLRWALGNA